MYHNYKQLHFSMLKQFFILIITLFCSKSFSISFSFYNKNSDSTSKKINIDTPIILKLKPNESYSIIFQSKGCFHSFIDTLIISKIDTNYFAINQNKTTLLDSADIKTIIKFEFYLQRNYKGSCTTNETYKVIYQNHIVRKMFDNSCQNYNFQFLIKNIFD